jgi:hypothetical protein
VVVQNGSDSTGIGGAEFGLSYDGTATSGLDQFGWTRCSDLDLADGGWPNPGSGVQVVWNTTSNCQNTPSTPDYSVIAVCGYVYMYAYTPDCLYITARPASGKAKVTNCKAVETVISGKAPSHLGVADFGPGAPCGPYRPCGAPTPVKQSTWGTIKSIYKGN